MLGKLLKNEKTGLRMVILRFIQDDIIGVVNVIVHSDTFPEVPLGMIPEMILCLSKEK